MMKYLIFTISLLAFFNTSLAKVYEWKDKGVTHFSDTAPKNNQQVTTLSLPSYDRAQAKPKAMPSTENPAPLKHEPKLPKQKYKDLTVTINGSTTDKRFKNHLTVRQKTPGILVGTYSLKTNIKPIHNQYLFNGDTIKAHINTEPPQTVVLRPKPGVSRQKFSIPNVYRGTYRLQITIYDKNNKVRIRSKPIDFTVRQHSKLSK